MKTITIVINKGGVGKTTSAQNIAVGLAKAGAKVLVIDLDSQASISRCFAISHDVKVNVCHFMANTAKFEQIVQHHSILDIIAGTEELLDQEDEIRASAFFPNNLKIALDSIKHLYDYMNEPISINMKKYFY